MYTLFVWTVVAMGGAGYGSYSKEFRTEHDWRSLTVTSTKKACENVAIELKLNTWRCIKTQ